MVEFLPPRAKTKSVGADSISARGRYRCRKRARVVGDADPYVFFERCASTAVHNLYYLLFFISYLFV